MVKPAVVDRLSILAGVALLVSGVAMVYVPAAFILSGSLLLAGVVWRAR